MFDDVYIQPAASDSGGAAGAALYAYYSLTDEPKIENQPYFTLGPGYGKEEIETFLTETGAPFRATDNEQLPGYVAKQLSAGKIVALFRGSMEFGPRALGFRSILADPRRVEMKEKINRAVKFRESFRPFAPVVLEEKAGEYFEKARKSPFMLFNFDVRPERREHIPAVTHKDGTSRIQTVAGGDNSFLYDILLEFERLTNIPVLLNTSFNLRGHPIARTPKDAFMTFVSSGIDILVMENMVLDKSNIDIERFKGFMIESGSD